MINEKVVTLDNGLTVIIASDNTKHSFGACLHVQFGSSSKNLIIDGKEVKLEDGVAHLLEHTICEKGPYGNLIKLYQSNYIESNASTFSEETRYYFKGYEDFYDNLIKLIKQVNESTFTEEDIIDVKKPIYEEIRMVKDNKSRTLYNEEKKSIYNNLDYELGTGEIDYISSFNYEDMRMIYDAFYKPSNEVLEIYGNVDIDKTLNLIEKTYNEINRNYIDGKIITIVDSVGVARKEYKYIDVSSYELVEVLYKLDVSDYTGEEKNTLIESLISYLDEITSYRSKLYNDMVRDGITKYSIKWGSFWGFNNNIFTIIINVIGNDVEEITKRIKSVFVDFNFPSEKDFNTYVKKKKMTLLLNEDNPAAIVSSYYSNYKYINLLKKDTIDDLNKFTLDVVKENIKKLDFSNNCVLIRQNK